MTTNPHPNEKVLQASCGPVRGNIYQHGDKIVHGYLGIPYAKPPIGELRFKKPEPSEPWNDVRDCTKYGPKFLQTNAFGDLIKTDVNDCGEAKGLSLNVFTPGWESKEFPESRPVMVFIHGGGYELGSSSDYDEISVTRQLPLKDLVVVTINYRIGFFGFLSTGDPECVENIGLWDQTLALKWVQKHILSFGGNPENVTFFGASAGGSSTDLLSFSPHSRDLFHKFCPLAGAAFCDFAVKTTEVQNIVAQEFATLHGYTDSGTYEMLMVLHGFDLTSNFSHRNLIRLVQKKSASVLCNFSKYQKSISGLVPLAPVIDGDFFPKPLEELRKEASKKPMLLGLGEYEALMFPKMLEPTFEMSDVYKKKFIEKFFGSDIFGENVKEKLHQKMLECYMNDVAGEDEHAKLKKLIEFLGDAIFNRGALESVQCSAKYGNDTFIYSFEYVNEDSQKVFGPMLPFKAATHGTDMSYILGQYKPFAFEFNSDDWVMMEQMTTIFSNFAKYGNPGWPKYSLEKPESHYRIALSDSGVGDVFQGGRCTTKLWDEIRENHKIHQKVVYGKDI